MQFISSGASRRSARSSRLAVGLMAGSAAAALLNGAALAAESAQPAAKASEEISEVVVTANRSGAESLQHVAMAISAVSADQLSRSGQVSIIDLMKYAPALTITQGAPGFNTFQMRGLMAMPYRTSDTSDRSLVAVYLDDTPISLQGQTPDLKVYDLERVEVLSGPQGTLYGAGSMAGTVRFITAKPNTGSMFGAMEASGSGTEHGSGNYSYRGMINVPLIRDQLALRATVYQGEDSGFINDIGVRNKTGVNVDRTTQARVALRYTPNAKLTVDFSYTYEKSRAYGLDSGFSGLPAYTVTTNGPEGTRDDFHLYNVNLDYDLGFADFVSSSSYTWRRIGFQASTEPSIAYFYEYGLPSYPTLGNPSTGYGGPPTNYSQAHTNAIPAEHYDITQKVHDFMQEARLVSKNDGPFKWTAGVFYEQQRRNLYQDIPVAGFDTQSYENYYYGPFNTPSGLYNSKTVDGAFNPNDIFSGLQNESEHQFAVFTDDTWHVTRKLDLTAGVRYFDFHENYYLYQGGTYGVLAGSGSILANHVPITETTSLSSHGFNPRFNAAYHVNDDLMVYAEVAKGFRYGGANQPIPLSYKAAGQTCAQNLAGYGFASAPETYGPDSLWSYSVGEKGKFAGGKLIVDADAYWVDWSNVQTRLLLNCSYFFTNNAGKIQSKGVELNTTWRVSREVTISANGAYNDSRAKGNIPTVGAFDGDKAPYSPRWVIGLTGFFDRPIGEGVAHLQVSYQYRGDEDTTFNPLATTICVKQANGTVLPANCTTAGQLVQNLSAYTLDTAGHRVTNGKNQNFAVIPASNDLSASLTYDIGRYELGIFGNNLADGVKVTNIAKEIGYIGTDQSGDRQTYARPRTVGARVKVKF